MVSYLIESAKTWPSDWALVLHNRYGLDKSTYQYYRQFRDQPNLYFSLNPEPDPNQLFKLLHSADLGIALYKSHENSIWLGKNIRHVGLASGKISTYLQHGVPVLVNEIGELSDCVRHHELGVVIDDSHPIQLSNINGSLKRWRQNCYNFFNSRLNLNYTILPVMQRIQQIINSSANHHGFRFRDNKSGQAISRIRPLRDCRAALR
jgi:glycosyltransferase involved in cell wall biosynthesis